MPKHKRYRSINKEKWTRKQQKLHFIRIKNKVTANNGWYYTHHCEDGNASWLDFYFMSTMHKKRLFSVAGCTLEMHEFDADESAAWDYVDHIDPLDPEFNFDTFLSGVKKVGSNGLVVFEMAPTPPERRAYYDRIDAVTKAKNKEPRMSKPYIEVQIGYGPVSIGLHIALNTPFMNEAAIIDFIKMFRAMGEPITPGIVWTGEEVEVVPANIKGRQNIEPININA